MQGRETCTQLGWSNPEAKRALSRLGIHDRIILKRILEYGKGGGGWPGFKRLYTWASRGLL